MPLLVVSEIKLLVIFLLTLLFWLNKSNAYIFNSNWSFFPITLRIEGLTK